ncbi:hypothetical protein LEMLEM_LOCUS16527, partial [Lemmus lemmus]
AAAPRGSSRSRSARSQRARRTRSSLAGSGAEQARGHRGHTLRSSAWPARLHRRTPVRRGPRRSRCCRLPGNPYPRKMEWTGFPSLSTLRRQLEHLKMLASAGSLERA